MLETVTVPDEFELLRYSPYEHAETAELQHFIVVAPEIQTIQSPQSIKRTIARVPSTPTWLRIQSPVPSIFLEQPSAFELKPSAFELKPSAFELK